MNIRETSSTVIRLFRLKWYIIGVLKLNTYAFIWVLFFSSLSNSASLNCKGLFLPSNYQVGTHFSIDPTFVITTRRPELQSLEAKYPGLTKQIFGIMNGPLSYFRWTEARPMNDHDAISIYSAARSMAYELEAIPENFNLEPIDSHQFKSFIKIFTNLIEASEKNYNSFELTSSKIYRFQSFYRGVQSSFGRLRGLPQLYSKCSKNWGETLS